MGTLPHWHLEQGQEDGGRDAVTTPRAHFPAAGTKLPATLLLPLPHAGDYLS